MRYGPHIIGIAGGSGAGKSYLAAQLIQALIPQKCTLLHEDNYYVDLSALPSAQREATNFDHPDAIDSDLLVSHLRRLAGGCDIHQPRYDFRTHCRLPVTTLKSPENIIILEGTLLFHFQKLRTLIDYKIFVRTTENVRYARRLSRDVSERGRSPESVVRQFERSVRPMYRQFVAPSRKFADIVISGADDNHGEVLRLVSDLRVKLGL